MSLVDALKKKQESRGNNQGEFAQYLGVSQSALSRIYRDKRGVGSQVLARILAKYPDLTPFFVQENANTGVAMAESIDRAGDGMGMSHGRVETHGASANSPHPHRRPA